MELFIFEGFTPVSKLQQLTHDTTELPKDFPLVTHVCSVTVPLFNET